VFPKLSERGQALLFAAALIGSVAGLYALVLSLQVPPVLASSVHEVGIEIEGSGWTITYRPNATSNNTVFGLLIEASRALGFSVRYAVYEIPNGVLVTAINGSANGDGGRYWQYWVNGAYGAVSADHRALHDNDVVMWEFTPSQEGG